MVVGRRATAARILEKRCVNKSLSALPTEYALAKPEHKRSYTRRKATALVKARPVSWETEITLVESCQGQDVRPAKPSQPASVRIFILWPRIAHRLFSMRRLLP